MLRSHSNVTKRIHEPLVRQYRPISEEVHIISQEDNLSFEIERELPKFTPVPMTAHDQLIKNLQEVVLFIEETQKKDEKTAFEIAHLNLIVSSEREERKKQEKILKKEIQELRDHLNLGKKAALIEPEEEYL
jgi:hypothetical protein